MAAKLAPCLLRLNTSLLQQAEKTNPPDILHSAIVFSTLTDNHPMIASVILAKASSMLSP